MHEFLRLFAVPALAVGLDLALGDPRSFPHPVRLLGWLLDRLESLIRGLGAPLRPAGWITAIGLAWACWWVTALLVSSPWLGWLLALYLAYAGLALGCLFREAGLVLGALEGGDVEGARARLAGLVSRDVSAMDPDDLRRSLAETLSENLNDGFTAPLFYLCLFGVPGLWAYKAISTMDSMWGYKTPEYRDLGQGGALLDDVLAWIPARLTARAMLLAGRTMGSRRRAAQAYGADAARMESPNAGWPMAAAAWLCEGTMGGPTPYGGEIKDKPVLGPVGNPWTGEKLARLLGLCRRTGLMLAGALIVIGGMLRLIF